MSYSIEEYNGITRITNIETSELDLDKTLKCGQAFRWNKLTDGSWYGTIGQKLVILKQGKFTDGKQGIATNLNIDDTKELIYYLNLDTNYTQEIGKLNLDDYASKVYEYGNGIHILRQDLFESMVTFLMSQFNSMHNIKLIVDKISMRYGNKVECEWFGTNVVYYTFPTLAQLSNCSYNDFMECSIGLRTKYLLSMIETLSNNTNILDSLRDCNYRDAITTLKQFDGIGDKVANCIALFSLHHVEAFPIDVHIKRIINNQYGGNIDISRYGKYAGIIQQYMFYYEAFRHKDN